MNLRIPLFSKAIDLQVDLIELDVHLSADGELMVIHDETVDRTTNGKGCKTNSQYWN
jgi:glycerophosphoryl diester phosphodiesterase